MISSLRIENNLPFIELKVFYSGEELLLKNVLVDTGSAGTILKLDLVEQIGIKSEPDDIIGSVLGVGGSEFVYIKMVDALELGGLRVENFKVDIGEMNYGFQIDGIIGMNFLLKIKSIIDLHALQIIC